MSEELKEQILKRLKSLLWRTGCFLAVGLISLVSDNLLSINVPPVVQAVAGLLLGELMKAVNNNTDLFGARLKK